MLAIFKKPIMIVLVVLAVLLTAIVFLYFRSKNEQYQKAVNNATAAEGKTTFEKDRDARIAYAKKIYEELKSAGLDFKIGPCLDNGAEWVVDVAHNPREPIDDNPANQCPAYVSGHAKHFVELDPDGNLIRAQ